MGKGISKVSWTMCARRREERWAPGEKEEGEEEGEEGGRERESWRRAS
jgi:hypothetical protein